MECDLDEDDPQNLVRYYLGGKRGRTTTIRKPVRTHHTCSQSGFMTNEKMSTTVVINDTMMLPAVETELVLFAKCHCCGLTEECTPAYMDTVRQRYDGNWLCGLCGEAVEDEILRSERFLSTEEAMTRHMSFCRESKSVDPPNPAVHLISAMRQILRRGLDSPRSTPNSPKGGNRMRLSRSEACLTSLTLKSSSYTDLQELMRG